MIEAETKKFIRDEIFRYLNVILRASVSESEIEQCSIDNMYPGMDKLTEIPVAHPYGFVSRAVDGTFCITARKGEHIGNRIVIAHEDRNRPDCEKGGSVLYALNVLGSLSRQLRINPDSIQIGSDESDEPLVLGNVLSAFFADIINLLKTVPIGLTTGPGSPIAANPAFATAIDALATQYLDTETTNILSQENFTERGGII